ncbi:ADP-ribose pyrophosphatase [Thermoanaerobacter sp. YS13]|uniref:NUDIX hydrolase n=1 Tax=Thermoanaerobacter sp. YS13 TaxID=1511746 RepID=UPI000575AEFD|nr:NUDIX hydrolase [Thermoanaerobacter sp. YS13]KHO62918.1 ADP-ribose pyrophosphatase [Thermoanaerobacter sp. YS13]
MKQIIVGVGGIVIKDNRVLLVRHTYGQFKGKWIIPGGHVEAGENIDDAVLREIKEETSIETHVKNIVSIRSILLPDGNSEIYIVFLLDYVSGRPTPDGIENDATAFFDIDKVIDDENVVYLSRYLIKKVLTHNYNKLSPDPFYPFSNFNYKLFC